MKKNGFTLVELLSVLVLIGLLLGIGVPGVMRISSKMKQRSLNTRICQIEQAATLWGQDNKTRLGNSKNSDCKSPDIPSPKECYRLSLSELISDDYLDGKKNSNIVENPVTGNDLVTTDNCVVEVYKKNNRVYATFNKYTCGGETEKLPDKTSCNSK